MRRKERGLTLPYIFNFSPMKPLRSNISDKELDFVERRLDGRVLPSLLENVKVAIRNDNLMTPKDQKFLEEVTQISDSDEFKTI